MKKQPLIKAYMTAHDIDKPHQINEIEYHAWVSKMQFIFEGQRGIEGVETDEDRRLFMEWLMKKIGMMRPLKDSDIYDGTKCDHCENGVMTGLGLDYRMGDNVFCCLECAEDYDKFIRQ